MKMVIIRTHANGDVKINSETFQFVNLNGMDLHRAILSHEDLSGSTLVGTNLRGAEIEYFYT
ncbi:pentapeptide repeat-containing protein [Paenibacillus agricola]|uniref:Pentapeptide repeat-containing protein n=1 Tax=Paenibacillus agricola TaxID=2716264 RepID=A0ABX0JI27_9BACL|nr:pentapeptide repeat-containing protein [Paenibacillus agricola]